MAQDALTQSAAALGVQTEPAENFFDPTQSRRLMARYAPASPEIASSKMLAEQADNQRQMDMREARFKHEQAVWGEQEKDMEHQKLIEEGSFLQTFAQLKPVIPLMKKDGTPELDEAGNPVMQVNPDYKPTVAKLFSEIKGLSRNKACQAIYASNNAEYQRVQTNQFKQQELQKSHDNRTDKETQAILTRGFQKGMKQKDFDPYIDPLTGRLDTLKAAEGVGSFNQGKVDTKEQESERKVLRKEHLSRIEKIAKSDLGLVGMSVPELENKFKERLQHSKDAGWVNSQGQPVSPDDALESTEEQFVDYATAPYQKYAPFSKPKKGQDNSPIDIPKEPPSTEPADAALWKKANIEWGRQRRSASNYYRVYHALRATKRYEDDLKELRGGKPTPPAGDANRSQKGEVSAPAAKSIDNDTAQGFLNAAKGDKEAARKLAIEAGYTF